MDSIFYDLDDFGEWMGHDDGCVGGYDELGAFRNEFVIRASNVICRNGDKATSGSSKIYKPFPLKRSLNTAKKDSPCDCS